MYAKAFCCLASAGRVDSSQPKKRRRGGAGKAGAWQQPWWYATLLLDTAALLFALQAGKHNTSVDKSKMKHLTSDTPFVQIESDVVLTLM